MAPLKIENKQSPDGHYTVTYHNPDRTVRREEGVTKDDKVITVWKYGVKDELSEPIILTVTQSTVLLPGDRVRILSSSYGERGAFTLEAVPARSAYDHGRRGVDWPRMADDHKRRHYYASKRLN